MQQLTQSNIISAIKQIDNSPSLRSGRESNTYDLIFQDRAYPPILVLSEANKLVGGKELTLKDFGNNTDKAFKVLRELGFTVAEKMRSSKNLINIKKFVDVAQLQETGLGTNDIAKEFIRANKDKYRNLDVSLSFGVGRATAIPWIAFTAYGQTVQDGIYPVYLYYKDYDLIILAYGVSETETPEAQWKTGKIIQSISEYFKTTVGSKVKKYGTSLVFKVYNATKLPTQKELQKDLDALIDEYKLLFNDVEQLAQYNQQFDIDNFISALDRSPFKFGREMVTRFVASLIAKPFVLLSGLSGSGKTKIAQTFAKWICASTDQYEIIPVGADWTNREPLLGYPDGLDRNNYVLPDNGALQLMLNAQENPALPYFLILDEMNLSHVERYFADFLSIMESNESIKLYAGNKRTSAITEIPYSISWPANLYIIGTVNIDETTYMFSPKVLDRANVIEFRLKAEDIAYFLSNSNGDHESVDGKGGSMTTDFVGLSAIKDLSPEPHTHKSLLSFFERLQPIGAEFGYRTMVEIIRLCDALQTISNKALSNDACMDIAIMQKLLPKIHGSRSKVARVLESLMGLCLHEELLPAKLLDASYTPIAKYPISFEKLRRMYKNALDNGFTSYAEA